MKIVSYEIPYTISRKEGGIELKLHEDDKKRVNEEALRDQEAATIPNIAKELGDFNDKQRNIVKHTLMRSQDTGTGKIILKYLE